MAKHSRCTETWHLEDEAIGPLIQNMHLGRRRVFRKGDVLYRQGSVNPMLYLVLRGLVVISSTREDGTEFTLEMMGPRAVCGEAAAFDERPSFTSAIALEETEAVMFHSADLAASFAEHPEIAVALLRITSRKQRIIAVRAQCLASHRPEARISELLQRLAEQYGIPDDEGTKIGISLTHQQIAALTGTTRVTVTRVLKRLREQGNLAISGRHVVVHDLPRLMRATTNRHP